MTGDMADDLYKTRRCKAGISLEPLDTSHASSDLQAIVAEAPCRASLQLSQSFAFAFGINFRLSCRALLWSVPLPKPTASIGPWRMQAEALAKCARAWEITLATVRSLFAERLREMNCQLNDPARLPARIS